MVAMISGQIGEMKPIRAVLTILLMAVLIFVSSKRAEAPSRAWEYGLEMTEIPAGYDEYFIRYETVFVPKNSGAVAYQYRTSITKEGSPQIDLQGLATVDDMGYTKIDTYYLIAMGQFYGEVGDRFRITMIIGIDTIQFKVILGDVKADAHTIGGKGVFGLDGSLVEFIVDKNIFVHTNIEQFRGVITNIEREV